MQITRANHFVSQSYLKRWSVDSTHIWCYRILVSNINVKLWDYKSIRSVAYQQDLYTEIRNGMEKDDFEKWITSEYEFPANEVIERIIRGDILSSLDWEKLSLYLASQDLRTPSNYINSVERWNKEFPKIFSTTIKNAIKKIQNIEELEKLNSNENSENILADTLKIEIIKDYKPEKKLSAIKASMTIGRQYWLNVQKYLLENTAKHLIKHKWSIVEAADGFEWVTSDNPVIKLNYYEPKKYDLRGGWGVKNGNIFMPISPRFLLFTQIGKFLPNNIKFSENETQFINRLIVENANREIYSLSQNKYVEVSRPRIVNRKQFKKERIFWKNWHEQQKKAENEKTNE